METNLNQKYDCEYYMVSDDEIRWVRNDIQVSYEDAYKTALILYDSVCEVVPNPDMKIKMTDKLCDRKDCMMIVLFNGSLTDSSNRIIKLGNGNFLGKFFEKYSVL